MKTVEAIKEFCEERKNALGIPGLAIGIVVDGRSFLRFTSGVAKLGTKKQIRRSTCFHMASVTKTLTAVAAMRLVEAGRLELDAPVARYLKGYRLAGDLETGITPRHLLSHTSGLPQAAYYDWENPEFDDEALERHVRSMAKLDPLFEPGEGFEYSDTGYELLGHLIAVVSGMSYERYVADHVMRPAKMKGASLVYRTIPSWRRAHPHLPDEDGVLLPSEIYPYHRKHAPSSTLCGSLEDAMSWIKFCNLLKLGQRPEVLSADGFDLLIRGERRTGGSFWRYAGHGFFSGKRRKLDFFGHEGSDAGFRAIVAVVPSIQGGLAILSNADGDHLKPVAKELIDLLAE